MVFSRKIQCSVTSLSDLRIIWLKKEFFLNTIASALFLKELNQHQDFTKAACLTMSIKIIFYWILYEWIEAFTFGLHCFLLETTQHIVSLSKICVLVQNIHRMIRIFSCLEVFGRVCCATDSVSLWCLLLLEFCVMTSTSIKLTPNSSLLPWRPDTHTQTVFLKVAPLGGVTVFQGPEL